MTGATPHDIAMEAARQKAHSFVGVTVWAHTADSIAREVIEAYIKAIEEHAGDAT